MKTPDEMLADVVGLDGDRFITQWECRFIRSLKSLAKAGKRPTLRQRDAIRSIHQKYFDAKGERR